MFTVIRPCSGARLSCVKGEFWFLRRWGLFFIYLYLDERWYFFHTNKLTNHILGCSLFWDCRQSYVQCGATSSAIYLRGLAHSTRDRLLRKLADTDNAYSNPSFFTTQPIRMLERVSQWACSWIFCLISKRKATAPSKNIIQQIKRFLALGCHCHANSHTVQTQKHWLGEYLAYNQIESHLFGSDVML